MFGRKARRIAELEAKVRMLEWSNKNLKSHLDGEKKKRERHQLEQRFEKATSAIEKCRQAVSDAAKEVADIKGVVLTPKPGLGVGGGPAGVSYSFVTGWT